MRSKFKWIFTLLVALSMQFSFAQDKTVTGVVSDNSGPLPGANVVVKGTTRGAQTDLDGKYSIKAKVGETLVFSFIGLEDQSKSVGAASTISVKLTEGKTVLSEVVIDGYRTTSKKKSSVAATTVTAEVIEGRPNVSFLQSLQAQAAGLSISTASGSPGSAKIDILLRGVGSAVGSTDPLFVIDGVPTNSVVFRGLNPEDIESATVLKDAGATAIYGNRGSNGVIVIKTRKGSFNSKMAFNFISNMGFTTLQDNDYNITNSREILTLERDFGLGVGATGGTGGGPLTDAEINSFRDTDWKKIFFRTGISKNNNLSFTTGSENMSNFTSLGFFEQQGIVKNTDFKRFSLRSNFTGKTSNDRFTYTTNLSTVFSKRTQLDQEVRTDINSNVLQNPLQGLLTSLPYLDPNVYVSGQQLFDDFGAPSFQIVPYMLMDYLAPGNIPSKFDETKILANFSGRYKLTKSLSYSLTTGIDYAQSDRDFARAPWSYLAIVATPAGATFGGTETRSTDKELGFNLVNKLNYTKTFKDKHTIDANLFLEYNKFHKQYASFTQNGLDPRTWALGAGTGYIPFNTATPTFYRPAVQALNRNAGLFSYFATVDYDYNSKYGLVGTIRRDASFRFTDDNTWGTFWSVSARWNIDAEKFMENSWFSELKLRGSYGTSGNQNIQSGTNVINAGLLPGNAGAFGINANFLGASLIRDLSSSQNGYGNAASIGVANVANLDLRWETTTQANIGIDFGIKKRLTGTVEVYRKKAEDLFDSDYLSAVTLSYTQNANTPTSIINTGVELTLRYDVFKNGNYKLSLFGNGSFNKNEYADLIYRPGADRVVTSASFAQQNGGPVDQYNLVPVYGINPANGNLWFLDINDQITETPTDADRRLTGKTYIPVYQGGFGFNTSYKGFYLNTQFSFAADVWRFDFDLTNLSSPDNIGTFPTTNDLLGAWNPSNTTSQYPSLSATNLAAGDDLSDRWLTEASYVRLKNLSLGYDVPKKSLEKTFLKGVRVYSQLENWITWSKWRGYDADGGLSPSNQGGYPSPKVISFGLDVQF